ncbi:hypothetical protein [Tsukamurella sp. 1534]|uniref:hypothetical protein n=1 Tax=Tsukamurella sp. 1534 TaxID=1151061 RepID=UPI0002DFFE0F|nr:hypothetical protein [Tsukamurella sp. 1534]
MNSTERKSLLPLGVAAARLAARRARAAARARMHDPDRLLDRDLHLESDSAVLTLLSDEVAVAAATGAGMRPDAARTAARDGNLFAPIVHYPEGGTDSAVCRVDPGTATAEVHLVPLGSHPDRRFAGPLAALADHLLRAVPGLRRVSLTVAADEPLTGTFLAAGFVDEGWAPPVGRWTDARMLTYLR